MRHYTAVKLDPDVTISEILAADYALAHLDADLRWLDLALDRFTALADTTARSVPTASTETSVPS